MRFGTGCQLCKTYGWLHHLQQRPSGAAGRLCKNCNVFALRRMDFATWTSLVGAVGRPKQRGIPGCKRTGAKRAALLFECAQSALMAVRTADKNI